MTDIAITRSGELMVSHLEGLTEAGTDCIDAYIPSRPGVEYAVVDSGRIILADEDVPEFVAESARRGLLVETREGI